MVGWALKKPSEDKSGNNFSLFLLLAHAAVSLFLWRCTHTFRLQNDRKWFSQGDEIITPLTKSLQCIFMCNRKNLNLNSSHWKLITLAKPFRALISAFGVQMVRDPAKTYNSLVQQHCWWKNTWNYLSVGCTWNPQPFLCSVSEFSKPTSFIISLWKQRSKPTWWGAK